MTTHPLADVASYFGQLKGADTDARGNLVLHFEQGRILVPYRSRDTLKEISRRLL